MIGNLFSAISIALFSSVLALGQVKADSDVVIGSSWVSGAQTDVILQSSIQHPIVGPDWVQNLYNSEGEVVDHPELPNGDITDNDFWYKFIEVNTPWSDYTDYDENCFALLTYRFSTPLEIDNHSFRFALRFGISPLSNVNGFEFRSNANCTVFQYGVGFSGFYYPYQFISGGRPTKNAIGLYSNNTSLSRTDSTLVNVSSTDVSPYKFIEFLVLFEAPVSSGVGHPYLNIDYQLISGTGDASFSTGYNQGYTQGSLDGYNKGYAAGLQTAQNSSFMGLFSSIADTPLRFIYGLFNFDLFGTSVLVIVLTLLTGIIVFGIVKKFWK